MNLNTQAYRILKNIKRLFNGSKDHRGQLLAQLPKNARCAEIGVWKGGFSSRILTESQPQELHLIDPWAFQSEFSDRIFGGSSAKGQSDMDAIYSDVCAKFAANENVKLHRGYSDAIMPQFEDHYFDWVYIDGNHHYEYVLQDLRLCMAKVKKSGIIAGDDYTWGRKYDFPVRRAVKDFLKEIDYKGKLQLFQSQFIIRL
jgi:hypothetical protein